MEDRRKSRSGSLPHGRSGFFSSSSAMQIEMASQDSRSERGLKVDEMPPMTRRKTLVTLIITAYMESRTRSPVETSPEKRRRKLENQHTLYESKGRALC